MIITIDGPAGTGKSTIAKQLAKRLSFDHVDTGAMYRAITWYFLSKKIDATKVGDMDKLLKEILLEFHGTSLFVNGQDVTEEIRKEYVSQAVSKVAEIEEIRHHMVKIQRSLAEGKNIVCEGRDIGTVVFPHAALKIFLYARAEVCAERRYKQLKEQFPNDTHLNIQTILEDIKKRDAYDSNRRLSPLKQAKDAVLIDTSDLTISEVIEKIISLYHERKNKN